MSVVYRHSRELRGMLKSRGRPSASGHIYVTSGSQGVLTQGWSLWDLEGKKNFITSQLNNYVNSVQNNKIYLVMAKLFNSIRGLTPVGAYAGV